MKPGQLVSINTYLHALLIDSHEHMGRKIWRVALGKKIFHILEENLTLL